MDGWMDWYISIRMFSSELSNHSFVTSHLKGLNREEQGEEEELAATYGKQMNLALLVPGL
uniref:Uncharacterized protein n=1 Tax=Anguilla anguilla TaxID=7936 RepID=A0A0E9QQ15_ANGAN